MAARKSAEMHLEQKVNFMLGTRTSSSASRRWQEVFIYHRIASSD